MISRPTKIIHFDEDIDIIWNAVKVYIEDDDAREDLDEEFQELDDDEKEDFFGEDIFDYMNNVVVGDTDLTFGVQKKTGDLGFWKDNDIDTGELLENKQMDIDEIEGDDEEEEEDEFKTNPNVEEYIKTIKNKSKKEYAKKYLFWVKSGRIGDSPDRPPELSYMASQAVRMTIDEFFPETEIIDDSEVPEHLKSK